MVGLSLPSEFTPPQDQSSFTVRITAPTGSDVAEADREAKKIEAALESHAEVKSVMANVSPGSADELPTSRLRAAHGVGDLAIVQAQHIVQHKRGPLGGAE